MHSQAPAPTSHGVYANTFGLTNTVKMSAQKVVYIIIKSILRASGEFQFYYTWIVVPRFFSISGEYSNNALLRISRHFI